MRQAETWLFLDSGAASPAMNMALDEVLLTRGESLPVVLRLYSWDPPGLSLGYFQSFEEMAANEPARACGAVITRRITGGDAILHIHELTFSLAGKDGLPPFHESVESSYRRIHLALARGFRLLGISSDLRDPAADTRHANVADGHQGRCFYSVTRYDLVGGGRKLVGSAQRRVKGRVLHHGSIPLTRNPMTPEAADLTSLRGSRVAYGEAAEAVRKGVEEFFDLRLEPWAPGDDLMEGARILARDKYGSPNWVERR